MPRRSSAPLNAPDAAGPLRDARRAVIQCKRHGAGVAAPMTTSRFAGTAVNYAQRTGTPCFDGQALAAWASRTGPAPWMGREGNAPSAPCPSWITF